MRETQNRVLTTLLRSTAVQSHVARFFDAAQAGLLFSENVLQRLNVEHLAGYAFVQWTPQLLQRSFVRRCRLLSRFLGSQIFRNVLNFLIRIASAQMCANVRKCAQSQSMKNDV
jgi:hypothetical protein